MTGSTNIKLLIADEPLERGARFNFEPIIGTLRQFIGSAPANATLNICVKGGWGSGKTTLLRGLRRAFADTAEGCVPHDPEPRCLPVWFDPWKLSAEADIRNALALKVLNKIALDADFVSNAEISIDRKNVLRALGERLLGINPDDLNALYNAETKVRDTFVEVEEIFRRVAEVYLNDPSQPRRLVIFVDDLDRCRPPTVTTVLESIKLFFDLPGLVFVFALDWDQLGRAVEADYGFDKDKARVYLEKMFQLTIPLPRKGAAELREFLDSHLQKIGVELKDEGLSAAIVNRFGRNLRDLKLFVNSFSFQHHLVQDIGDIDEEILFKWLFLEATMNRSLTAALRGGTLEIVIALEFLAHGGFLHDDALHARYVKELSAGQMNLPGLIAYAIMSMQNAVELPSIHLGAAEQVIVDALIADGSIPSTLKVLREGEKRFVDVDLRQVAFLTRSEEETESAEAQRPSEATPRADWSARPLPAKTWDTLGTKFDAAQDFPNAYLAHLMAYIMRPTYANHICSMARTFRRMHALDAARVMFRKTAEVSPNLAYLWVEFAYMYDLDMEEEGIGSLLYRKALSCGSTTSGPPYYLSFNLHAEKQYDQAYLACLDACVKDPDNSTKRARLVRYARDSGRYPNARRRTNEELEQELNEAMVAGSYPFPFTEEEEKHAAAFLNAEVATARSVEQLSRPPF